MFRDPPTRRASPLIMVPPGQFHGNECPLRLFDTRVLRRRRERHVPHGTLSLCTCPARVNVFQAMVTVSLSRLERVGVVSRTGCSGVEVTTVLYRAISHNPLLLFT